MKNQNPAEQPVQFAYSIIGTDLQNAVTAGSHQLRYHLHHPLSWRLWSRLVWKRFEQIFVSAEELLDQRYIFSTAWVIFHQYLTFVHLDTICMRNLCFGSNCRNCDRFIPQITFNFHTLNIKNMKIPAIFWIDFPKDVNKNLSFGANHL